MGYIEKSIATDEQEGYDYYSYVITELGIDTLLKNEDMLNPKQPKFDDGFDDTIPF